VDAAFNELVRPGSARRWSSPSIVSEANGRLTSVILAVISSSWRRITAGRAQKKPTAVKQTGAGF
jgi:hypothetical protein